MNDQSMEKWKRARHERFLAASQFRGFWTWKVLNWGVGLCVCAFTFLIIKFVLYLYWKYDLNSQTWAGEHSHSAKSGIWKLYKNDCS